MGKHDLRGIPIREDGFKGVICVRVCMWESDSEDTAEFMRTTNRQTATHMIFGGRLASHHLRQSREWMGTDALIHYLWGVTTTS